MYTKEFPKFVFEVEGKILDMPYFYFGKYSLFISHLLKFDLKFHVTFSAFIILGLGSGVSLIVFIFEHIFVKYRVIHLIVDQE